MRRGPKGEKRSADVIGNTAPVMRIATGEVDDTPTEAELSDTLWSMTDLAEMIDPSLPRPGKRGPYKVRENSNWDTTCQTGVR